MTLSKKELLAPQASHHSRRPSGTIKHRPSMPIEIPTRRKTIISTIPSSPSIRSTSPELIFEMSPVSSNFPSSSATHYPLNLAASPKNNDHEPFMYHFPDFPAYQTDSGHRTLSTSRTRTCACSPVMTKVHHESQPYQKQNISSTARLEEADIPSAADSLVVRPVVRPDETNKIIGFAPIIAIQPSVPKQTRTSVQYTRHLRPLSPPSPRFSSPPWILSDEILDAEIALDEIDPGTLEFERYLIRRIGDEKPARFRPVKPIRSARVSFRG